MESNKSLQAQVDNLEHDLDVTKGLLDAAENSKSILMEQLKRVRDIVGEQVWDGSTEKTMKQLFEEHLNTLE